MPGHDADPLTARPEVGRIWRHERRIRLGDSSIAGRLRLDACARYLQDIANDDAREGEMPNFTAWVARRTVIDVERFPEYLDVVELATWCSGLGPRWAERRYDVRLAGADASPDVLIRAATLWVHIDLQTMQTRPIPTGFVETFGAAAQGRTVSARLRLPTQVDDSVSVERLAWAARVADFDLLGHVNNAVYWSMIEDVIDGDGGAPLRLVLEHHDAIDVGDDVVTTVLRRADGADLWIHATDPAGVGRLVAVVEARRADGAD